MEENNIQVQDYSTYFLELQESNNKLNETLNKVLNHLEVEKQEKQEKEKQEKIQLEEDKKIEEENAEIQSKIDTAREERNEEFFTNIETITKNSNPEVTTDIVTQVNTLMQVNIMCMGLLIGIICISLLSKFFKRS